MDEKISLDVMAQYADQYADKVMERHFSSKQKINGREILSLSDVHQVNLFVIRELFKTWQAEAEKQKSVYFDYENEEVKEALTTYMSVLSNHISVSREHLAPLLREAVQQTLMVIFNPYDFYASLISGKADKLDVVTFREELKYLKINREPLERMLRKLEEKGVTAVPGNEAFAVLDQVLEEVNFTPEDLEGYIGKFSELIPLKATSFYPDSQVEEQAPPQPEKKAVNKYKEPEPFRANEATLHDNFNRSKQPTLIDSFQKIARIKESLTINQKFMFTKVLFYGDFESFSRAVDELDQLGNMDEALGYLEQHASTWDRESREFHEFMEMVEKRFS